MFKPGNKTTSPSTADVGTPAEPSEACECAALVAQLREQLDELIDRTRSGIHPSSPRAARERAATAAWVKEWAAQQQAKDEASARQLHAEFLEEWNKEPTYPVDRQMFGRRITVGEGADDPGFRFRD